MLKKTLFCIWISTIALCPVFAQDSQPLNSIESNLTRQQKINRSSLIEGANDQIRLDAAIELLLSEDKVARQVLIDGLKQSENIAAQSAICKALAQSRSWQTAVRNKSDFIEPLFNILLAQSDATAKFAAEAMLICEYKQLDSRLEKIVSDAGYDTQVRLHAIYALKLRPEKEAIFVLIKLSEEQNKQVAEAAAMALQDSLGIPVGTEHKVWEQIVKELDRKSTDEFVRDRLVRQEARVHQLEGSIKKWQTLYLAALEIMYKGINDDAAKSAFLTERLSSDEPDVQLWAIRRVSEWRMGNKPLPPAFGPILLSFISANDSAVRLETAKLLAVTSYLGPAPEIMKQLQIEKDEEVKAELLTALGEACNYAYVFKSEITVSDEIQKAARELAVNYLSDSSSKKARRGAEVLGKLLTNSIGDANEAKGNLLLIAKRYEDLNADANSSLKAPLLDVMGGLCGQGAAYRAEASEIFEPLLIRSLTDKETSVRESAVSAIIKIDGPHALAILSDDMKNDPSTTIRTNIIDLAGKIGGPNDLKWMAEKLDAGIEGDAAWRAMMEIFKRSDSPMISEWVIRFENDNVVGLSAERKIALLELAEQKAGAENNSTMLNAVRKRLADAYNQQGQFDKAIQYYGMLAEAATGSERETLLILLFDVRLKAKQYDAAGQLIANRLLEKDIDANDVFVSGINKYLTESADANDSVVLVKTLCGINCGQGKSKWQQQVLKWRTKYELNQPASVSAAADANIAATASLDKQKI